MNRRGLWGHNRSLLRTCDSSGTNQLGMGFAEGRPVRLTHRPRSPTSNLTPSRLTISAQLDLTFLFPQTTDSHSSLLLCRSQRILRDSLRRVDFGQQRLSNM